MTVAEIAENKARYMIAQRTTEEIVTDFETTEKINMPEIYRVRGWLMDELEKRNGEAFEAWIDSNEESPRKYFVK